LCFTHVDPFEDTERRAASAMAPMPFWMVSPTSIRSRILKEPAGRAGMGRHASFTHVDPFEDTERRDDAIGEAVARSFTHVDPFEDTERRQATGRLPREQTGFTHVDPFEDTERRDRQARVLLQDSRFTHVDPFEDTESLGDHDVAVL